MYGSSGDQFNSQTFVVNLFLQPPILTNMQIERFRTAFLALLLFWQCNPARISVAHQGAKVHGLSFVAPPQPFPSDPMPAVQQVAADWIAVIPYAFTRPGEAAVYFNNQRQWWGERSEGVSETLRLAKASGIKVMLKPQLWVMRSWTGDLDYATEAEWTQWEAGYRDYVLTFARLAADQQVELYCIGTEFKKAVGKREAFWRKLIQEVREIYTGQLTYAANWDEYEQVPFWDALDYIGVNAYFPLSEAHTPEVAVLQKAWKVPLQDIRRLAHTKGKPVLFTEYGYLSVDGCAGKTWELEGKIDALSINQQAQANALEALLATFSKEAWWAGGFLWKWFPHMQGHEGYPAKDYTPQGKAAEQVLKEAHGRW